VNAGLAALIPIVGIRAACDALGVSRASYYRKRRPPPEPRSRPTPPRALSHEERARVLKMLDSERFMDKAPAQVYAELLDDGEHLCSIRTMYRVLAVSAQIRERRDQAQHPRYVKPQLEATAPNQVWSWDITRLPGPQRGTYYSLYVVLDIFSRYVVAWTVAPSESAVVTKHMFADACEREGICPGQLTIHADRGVAMTALSTVNLYARLGILPSYSRPRVCDDNPFSEAAFKTLLYRPEMPDRFGSLEHAQAQCADLFHWYNEQHFHSGIVLLTPSDVHHGRAPAIIAARQKALDAAYARHPERFVHGAPIHRQLPSVVWINPPSTAFSLNTVDR
jgi:putative transposase